MEEQEVVTEEESTQKPDGGSRGGRPTLRTAHIWLAQTPSQTPPTVTPHTPAAGLLWLSSCAFVLGYDAACYSLPVFLHSETSAGERVG